MSKTIQSIEPEVKDNFTSLMREYKTKYNIEQKAINDTIAEALKKARSKSGGSGSNRPDFEMLIETPDLKKYPVMIEAKGKKGKLEKFSHGKIANTDKDGNPNFKNIQDYAVNGAVHYAKAILDFTEDYDTIIAVGVNGYDDAAGRHYERAIYLVTKETLQAPKKLGDDLSLLYKANIKTLADKIEKAQMTSAELEEKTKKTENIIDKNLKKLNQFMHDGLGIAAGKRVGLVAGMIMASLGVENKVAGLEISDLKGQKSSVTNDGTIFIDKIRAFLTEKGLPADKIKIVENDLYAPFVGDELWKPENGESKLKTLYALVNRDIAPYLDQSREGFLDFTGKLFNVLTEWIDIPDGEKNDVVLTPRYVTDLMAKLCRVNKDSYVWDYAAGTAGFLVSSMKLMLKDAENIKNLEERETKKRDIRALQLLGVEKRSDIYLLAVLNMILMRDGSANIIQADSLKDYDGTYWQGKRKGEQFPANVFLLNPPYSADGKGFVFVEKALGKMKTGRAAVLIQENAGSGTGLPFTKRLLEKNKLVASIHMADIFFGKANVKTAVYVFQVGTPHDVKDEVLFIDMSDDGYTRQHRKKASSATNLKNVDHATERYQEVVDIVLGRKCEHKYYKEGEHVIKDCITLEGDDWTFNQHKEIDTMPTEEDFKRTVANYLAWKVSAILKGEVACNE